MNAIILAARLISYRTRLNTVMSNPMNHQSALRYTKVHDLLAKMPRGYRRGEKAFGRPVGKEVW